MQDKSVLFNVVKVYIKWRTTWPAPIASPPPSSIRIARMMARSCAAYAERSWRPLANTGNLCKKMQERQECKLLAVRKIGKICLELIGLEEAFLSIRKPPF
jgi:hypothetical protein